MPRGKSGERRVEILATFAQMLAEQHGKHITTAGLAKAVGVSEAALYRHFPSKAKMFEALIEFIEESIFSRINVIMREENHFEKRLDLIITLIFGFAEKNPGITRLLQGDVLVGEKARLRERTAQLMSRLETQFRQILREGEMQTNEQLAVNATSQLLIAIIEGRIAHYVRTDYRVSPLENWSEQWQMLHTGLFSRIRAEAI